jgi:DeoR/GlpR family transcriptional regulator of sugar metabolism
MIREERLRRMQEIFLKEGFVTSAKLARTLGVSEISIRRDLSVLSDRGLVQRIRGGAIMLPQPSPEPPIIKRLVQQKENKEAIARAAASQIQDGDLIFLGSGSTTAYITQYLTEYQSLTVVTNALNVSTSLAIAPNITVVVLGGMMRHAELSLVGHIAEQSLNEVAFDKAIIGIPAINLKAGLTNNYLPEVVTDRVILNKARQVILIADHTKVGKIASAFVASLDKISVFITDSQTDPEFLEQVRKMGIQVIVAETEPLMPDDKPESN